MVTTRNDLSGCLSRGSNYHPSHLTKLMMYCVLCL